jgi:predicted DNA-binding transcriptional regulator AlpA
MKNAPRDEPVLRALGDDVLITLDEVLNLIPVSRRTFSRLREKKNFPDPHSQVDSPIWRLGTVRQWIREEATT